MWGFGFKIVDRARQQIEPLVEASLRNRNPIEIGLYFGDAPTLDYLKQTLKGADIPVAVHLDHRQLSIFHIQDRLSLLRGQLETAASLGASYVITHLSPYPMTQRPQMRDAMLEKIVPSLEFTTQICSEYGLDVHLENTYHTLAFYRRLFRGFTAGGLEDVNVCFDLGHAKVWSTETLGEWLGFLEHLEATGLRIHFHLHANRGLNDDHLSFVAADRLGLTGPDDFTRGTDYYRALAELAARFPNSSKVFEVPAQEAEDNLRHVLERIASLEGETGVAEECVDFRPAPSPTP